MRGQRLREILFWAALAQLIGYFLWALSPVKHDYESTGIFIVDYVAMPLGGISLVVLIIGAIYGKWRDQP